MTVEFAREISARLVETELEGDRTAPGYRKEVGRNILRFFAWLKTRGAESVEGIGKEELLAYYRHACSERVTTGTRKPGEPISRRTINGRIAAVRKVFAALYRAGYLADDPCLGLELGAPPDRSFRRLPFTEAEMDAFLEEIDPGDPRSLRDRALFELLYSSGLRVAEAAKLAAGDVDLERREVVVHGKGGRDRVVPVSEPARDFLKLHLGGRLNRTGEPVFRSTKGPGAGKPLRPQAVTRRFRALLERKGADGDGRSAHSVRHSTATHLLDRGAGIRLVQELLGHKSIETTARYTQVLAPGLQKIYRKHHPGEHELFETVDGGYLERLEKLEKPPGKKLEKNVKKTVAEKKGGVVK
jgi:site-specific recombinase XerD